MSHHLRRYIKALLVLTLFGLIERVIFATYHGELTEPLAAGEILHALLWGLRYDAAIAAMLAFVAMALGYLAFRLSFSSFATAMRRSVYLAAMALIALHGADLLYFGEAGRHMGYELRDAYTSGGELLASALATYTGPVLLQLMLMFPALWLVKRALSDDPGGDHNRSGWRRLMPELQLGVAIVLTGIIGRGGIQGVPLEPLHAQRLGDARQAAVALNGAYNALFSSATPYSTERVMKEEPGPADWKTVRKLYADNAAPSTSAPRESNVVFVFLESWSAAFVSSYGYDLPTTPVFDELRRKGLSTGAMLAGGRRTTEGMFASLCSAQNPLGNTVAQGQLQNYPYHCVPHLLRDAGYETAFFQGTVSGTSGTGAFAQLLGFERSYGKEHMDLDSLRYERNSWGVHDPDLYDFTLEKMAAMSQPFLVGINSLFSLKVTRPMVHGKKCCA